MSRVNNIISGVQKNGTQKKKSRVDSIIENSLNGNLKTGVDENYINTFLKDARDYFSSVDKDYKNIGYQNASSLYDDYSSKSVELGRRASTIRAHLNSNRNSIDEKTYNDLMKTLNDFDTNRSSVSNQLLKSSQYYSQWDTEDDYKKDVKAQKDYEAMTTFDLKAGKAEIEGLLNGDETTALRKRQTEIKEQMGKLGNQTKGNGAIKKQQLQKELNEVNAQIKEIENQASQKKVYWNQAKHIQDGLKLTNDALNDIDFGDYNTTNKEFADDRTYKYINNIDNFKNTEDSFWLKHSTYTNDQGLTFSSEKPTYIDANYEHMTDDEKSIFNYYYSKFGKEKAYEYLANLEQTLNTRSATKIRQQNDTDLERMLFGVVAGLDQFSSGMENLFNTKDDYITPSDTQIASGMIREDLGDSDFKILGSTVGQIGYDLINTTSNMLPSILTSTVVGWMNPAAGAVVGAGLMGASAGGNAYAEMLNLGYDKGQARMYSTMVGVSEAALQYVLGGIGKLGSKWTTKGLVKLADSLDNAVARVAIKLGSNAASEFTEEYLQEVLNPFFKNITLGTNEDVKLFSTEALYSGILGALSAGVLEGGSTISSDIQTTKLGKSVQKVDGGVERLKKLGTTFSADSVAYQIADKVTEETGAYKIGLLLQEAGATLSEQNVSDIVIELTKKGMDERSAKSIAKTYQAFLNNEMSLTDEQVEVLEGLDPLADVLRKSIIGKNTSIYQRTREYNDLVQLATEMESNTDAPHVPEVDVEETPQTVAPYSQEYVDSVVKEFEAMGMPTEHAKIMAEKKLSAPTESNSTPTEENLVESKYEVSAEGKTINKTNDEIVNVKKIESISGDGEANLTLDDGMVVKASDLSFGSDAEAVFVENIGAIKVGKNPISTNSANSLYMTAMSAFKANPNMTASEAMSLIKGLTESYVYGTYNLGRSKLTSRNEDGSARLFAGELTQSQRKFAYELGTKDAVNEAEADQKVIDELKAKSDPKTAKKSLGEVIFEKGAEVDESTLTATQKANLDGIKLLAKISNVKFHVFRSDKVGNTYKYTMPDGTVTGANGWFVSGTNEIWIDLNAGNAGEGTMIRTAAHEISHYIKEWSPKKWRAMADLLMESFAENGVNTESMLNRQIAKIKKRYKANKKAMPSQSVLLDMAYEELVSDALSDMLTDGSIVNFIAEVKAKDRNLAQKILDAIKSLLKKWGLVIDDYKGRELDTPEAQALSQLEDTFKKLQVMYRDAFMDANETVATIGVRNLADFAEAKNTEGETLFQYRAMEADESTYRDMLKKWGKMTDTQINNLFTTIDRAMDIIKDNLEVLDYAWESDIDDRAFSPVKPNSDSLYQVSLDFSTLCRKRILQQTVQAHLQEALNKPLTREEGIAIRDALMALQEEGRQIEVACALCYVESARMKSPAQIKKFLNNRESVIKDFFAGKSGGSMKDKIKRAEIDARENLHKENPNGIKGKDGSMLDPRTASLKAMPKKYADAIRDAKKGAKESYKPTAEEQKLIDVAKGMTVTDFTSPEGLENLAKNYPALFDAYTSYIRNATKSKGIEGDTWWRAGDSQKIGDVLIANMNRENGLRSQSWSDFQVIHILDYIAATIELSTRNAKEQAYSKVPDYVELMGQTGVMINMSLIPTRDFNGSLEYDSVEGIAYKRALELREKYPATAGTICIGVDNKQIQMLLADATIDYVIPYHKSGMAASVRKLMHIPTWSQYEEYQSEKNLSKKDAEAQAKNYGVKLLEESDPNYHKHTAFSEWFDLEVAKQIAKMENGNPSNKAMQKKYGVMYGGYMAMQDAANNYLKLCAERGIAPKFSHENADFTAEDNYWKLLIDRKMVNNATGEIIEQQAIKPIFDEGEVLRILNDELERYPSVKADQEYATRKVTEKFLSDEIKSGMSAEAIAKVMKTPVDNITKTNIVASVEGEMMMSERVTADMNDAERADVLKKKNITDIPAVKTIPHSIIKKLESISSWGDINKLFGSNKRTLIQKLASEFGVFKNYDNSDIKISFQFSTNNFRESYHKQKVNYEQFAKMFSVFDSIVKNAVGIEVHKRDDYKPDITLNNVYVLISAFEDGDFFVPIKLEVKEFNDKQNTLYVAISLEAIKKTEVSKQGTTENSVAQNSRSATINVADLMQKVNPLDTNFTKYFPNELLTEEQRKALEPKEDIRYSERDLAPTFYSQMGKVVEGVKQEKLAANSVVNMLRGKGVKAEEIRWSGIVPFLEGKKSVTKQELLDFINGSMLQIGEQMSSNDIDLRYDSSEHTYRLYDKEGNVINTYAYNEFMGGYVSENDDEIYTFSTDIEDAVREEYGSMSSPRWSQYKLDGGSNYHELVFTMPNSTYRNQMMKVHWGDEAEGVLVHARIQDFDVNGKKMLFIEEIQSDWHNEGHKDGYQDDAKLKELQELEAKANEAFHVLENYSTELTGLAGEYEAVAKTQKGRELLRAKIRAEKALKQAEIEFDTKVPDAPFKDNYHEFVLKRLLRMAAEQGYDSIGWTPADIQSKRWSDEFAEGYRIEYDQDMPKFLKKYGRQWGAKVDKSFIPNSKSTNEYIAKRISAIEGYIKEGEESTSAEFKITESYRELIEGWKKDIENFKEKAKGREVWSMDITDSMKNSVLYEGQAMYSDRDTSTSNRSILANALESVAQSDIERNKLAQYKEKISLIESEEKRLSEIQKQLFTKGAVEPSERKDLQFEAKQIANRINTYDRQLLNLESTTALKNVLNREKALAMKRQKQKDTEYLKQYKEKVAKTQRELLERNQESRKKAIEGREKTAMRHKIQKVVGDLNNLLLKPSKERHVPEEMRIAVAEALTVVNMDTVGADERVAKYNDLIAKAKDPDVIASLTETRDRILNQGNKLSDKLTKLKEAYEMVRDSADDSVKSMYDDVIYSRIQTVKNKVGKTPIRNMTLEQLENVYDLYKMVLTTVRDSNKAFAENITMTRLALGSNTFAEIKENNKARDTIKHPFLEKSLWQNLKPMQAMKTIGSGTLQKLWNNILYGQEVFAVDYDEAVKFAKEMKEKHGYKKWNKDKLYSFASKSGKTMKLNLEQMMSIYAYSKRAQADEHIEYGGIVLNEGVIKVKNKLGKTVEVKVNDSTAYRLDKMQVANIVATLEKEFPGAKAFVDEMQKYLSETMGAKGNEVSMKMYGIKLFKEEHYFPLKSSKDFMEAANAKLKGDVKIKNKGMTKSTVEHARNPIVLENFLDVWGNHINEMALYHGLVLPLEDFSRTLNYSFKADEKLNADAESVRTALHDAFGDNADNYLNELLKAINGGVLHDSSAAIADKMIGKFKKAKVMASLSVVVQQPTAIIRAMGIIDPKYFVAQNFNHKATWEELKKYCPTAIIKETGSFDTNMGRTIVDMVKEETNFIDKVGDVLGKAPAYMDEVGWNMIWRALKKKVATEQKLSGEELLQECGKQMTLIINETQVYDSVMSRNELMRSKSALTKMATAFMAEPSTVANMIYGAALDIKRGKKGVAGKTVAAVISSVVVNGLVSAMVYALRDDDEEKTLLEKYLSSATSEVLDGLNPLTYIPFVKDVYSIFQGYKAERTDLALFKDLVDAIDDFYNVLDPEAYEGMSRNEIAKHIYENAKPLLTSTCDMFGLPVGNILRDAEAIIINDNVPMSHTSSSGTGYAFKEGALSILPKFVQKIIGTDSKQDKLYDAIVSGDTAYIKRLKSGYKDDKAYETAVRKALRESDPRIREAAEARISGNIVEYSRIVKEIKAEGFFSQDTIVASVNAEINAINKGKDTEPSSNSNKANSMYKIEDYYASIVGGDQASAYVVKEDLINTDIANGKDRDEAESSFNGKFASYLREEYEKGNISTREAQRMLVNYGDKTEEEATSKVQYWEFKQEYPDYDDLSEEAVTKYYEKVEPYGISVGVYYDYSKQRSKCKGTDNNGDGKTDSGSVKAEVLRVINSLPISRSQKDALYYLNGWSAKTIYEAPWH